MGRRRDRTMKNFQNYTPEKYASPDYQLAEEGIYLTAKPKNMLFGLAVK